MHKSFLIAVAATMFATATIAGPMTLLEEAAEFDRLDARVSSNGDGLMRITPCDGCQELRLALHAGTQLEINGEKRPIKAVNDGALRDGVVFYDAGTKRVLRLVASR